MRDETQLAVYTDKPSAPQAICAETGLAEGCNGELVENNYGVAGAAEYEKGKRFCAEKNYPEALKWTTLSADLGNIKAMLMLGLVYRRGSGVEKSFELAKNYCSKVAEEESIKGEYCLGELYHKWEGPEKDLSVAMHYYTQSADRGHEDAILQLGHIYRRGTGVEKSFEMAKKYYSKAVAVGSIKGDYWLGFLYQNWEGVEKDLSSAVRHYMRSADRGYEYAMLGLGNIYREGTGVKKSFEMAKKYYSAAAKLGGVGEFLLGYLYGTWDGEEKDLSVAMYHYAQSVDRGYNNGALSLGMAYYRGEGVKKDYVKAISYIERLVFVEDFVPITVLTSIYLEGGNGIEKNIEKAIYYAEIALNKSQRRKDAKATEENLGKDFVIIGYEFETAGDYKKALDFYEKVLSLKYSLPQHRCGALVGIGVIYYYGNSVARDFARAVSFYETGSNAGCAESKAWLGRMYFLGRGVQKDIAKAFELFEVAYSLKSEMAANSLCSIYANGYGVEKDLYKAISYCEKGSEKDICQGGLGKLYYYTKQYAKAIPCMMKVFDLREDDKEAAAYVLSLMYIDGEEIGRNFNIARQWAEKTTTVRREVLLNYMDHLIPEALQNHPEATSYSLKLNVDYFTSHGFLGLTADEEEMSFHRETNGEPGLIFKVIE